MNKISKKIIYKIQNLRKKGYSIPEISRNLKLSKSTALKYSKNVKILPRHYQRWLNRRNASKIISERHWFIASQKAKKHINTITEKDLIIIAASLYWAEGTKKDFTFFNSDARMIKIFIYILKKVFGIKNKDFKISLRIYEDLNKYACIKYWSKITKIKLDNNIHVDILKGNKNGKLQYGMCRIRIKKSGLLLKEFHMLIDQIASLSSPRRSMDRTRVS